MVRSIVSGATHPSVMALFWLLSFWLTGDWMFFERSLSPWSAGKPYSRFSSADFFGKTWSFSTASVAAAAQVATIEVSSHLDGAQIGHRSTGSCKPFHIPSFHPSQPTFSLTVALPHSTHFTLSHITDYLTQLAAGHIRRRQKRITRRPEPDPSPFASADEKVHKHPKYHHHHHHHHLHHHLHHHHCHPPMEWWNAVKSCVN